eukprot:4878796-Amphidinium_carterae.1
MQKWAESVRCPCHVHAGPSSCELMPYTHAVQVEAALAMGLESAGVFMDIRRAFEQVCHKDLLHATPNLAAAGEHRQADKRYDFARMLTRL